MIIVTPILMMILRIVSMLLFAFTIATGFAGVVNPMHWATPAILALLFPYLAIATVIVSVLWLVTRNFITGGLGVLSLIVCGNALSMALPVQFGKKAQPGEVTFTLAAFNCTHFEDLRQPGVVPNRSLQWVIDCGADIVGLAENYTMVHETKKSMTPEQLDSLRKVYPYISRNGDHDVQLMSKYPFTEIECPIFEINDEKIEKTYWFRSYGLYKFHIQGRRINIMVVHLPSFMLSEAERGIITEMKNINGARQSLKEFKGTVMEKMKAAFRFRAMVTERLVELLKQVEGPTIICGDFNDVPASWCYRQFLKAGFEDAYTETCFGHMATYNMHMMYFHIDQIFYRGPIRPLKVRKSNLDASDHYPLIADFAFTLKEIDS